ncbi:methyltransferase domain-containing protein [Enterococcus mundtii]|uniref:methyltransferase domain-containing protein n=1 Tax=Enterococcus TaxID=1350 RepID=UPI000D3839AD|nr:methyltransferase domain-containing protein [Enterococcus mundtii]PTO37129.1 glycosyl transferase family 2 [Enterococcus mundtii]PTO45024.1 glycosyl transferase family 2 [Enterococcus mundtii]
MKYDFEMDLDEQSSVGKIVGQIKPGSKVLEFGPGNGRMTKHLIGAKNCEVSIVELDKELFDYVNEIAQDGFYGDIESFEWAKYYAGQTFDYILFADVLEHLVDPLKTLKKVREFLNEEGEILITFPNLVHNSVLIHLFNNELPWASFGLLDETHNSFYTHEGFQKVFAKADLHINIEDYLYLAVGDTELKSAYTDLPEAVRYDFKMRPFGEVYQYFFSLKKHPNVEAKINTPQNSNYVKMIEIIKNSTQEETLQIPFNNHTGENQELTFPLTEEPTSFIFQFEKQPSYLEFSVEVDGVKLDFITSNAVIKTATDCYIFDGSEAPRLELTDISGETIKISCHYRFIGELPATMAEVLREIKPMAAVQKELSAENERLTKENQRLQAENKELTRVLKTTTDRYYDLLQPNNWAIKPKGRLVKSKETAKKIQAKELSLCVDEKSWDPEKKLLKIIGWGISNAERKPLSYKLSVDQSPFFEVQQIERVEVNEAEKLPPHTKAGFEIQIACEQEKSFLFELIAENGQSWLVEM